MKDWKFMLLLILSGLAFVVASLFGDTNKIANLKSTNITASISNSGLVLGDSLTPYTFGTAYSGAAPAGFYDAEWLDNGKQICRMQLATNVLTEWITVEDHRPTSNWDGTIDISKLTNATFFTPAFMRYDDVKQLGFLVTNRVLRVIHDNVTNDVHLKTLWRDEWPSQKRTLSIPR